MWCTVWRWILGSRVSSFLHIGKVHKGIRDCAPCDEYWLIDHHYHNFSQKIAGIGLPQKWLQLTLLRCLYLDSLNLHQVCDARYAVGARELYRPNGYQYCEQCASRLYCHLSFAILWSMSVTLILLRMSSFLILAVVLLALPSPMPFGWPWAFFRGPYWVIMVQWLITHHLRVVKILGYSKNVTALKLPLKIVIES